MSQVRAKFSVTKIEQYSHPPNTGTVSFCAVYKSEPGVSGNACKENLIFGSATPSASLSMNIQNPEAFKVFRNALDSGKPFYVDFTEAPE